MEQKLEETITDICNWIQKELKDEDLYEGGRVPEMTKALAELVKAKADATRF